MRFLDSIPTRLLAAAGIAGGATWAASAVLRLTGGDEMTTDVLEKANEHVYLGLFSLALFLTAAGMLGLARHAATRTPALVAGAGLVALSLTCIVSNVNGDDPSFFVVVAPVTNLMWFAGSVWLAVALRRAGEMPRAVWIALPFMQIFALPLSAVGGMAITGAYWMAVGYLLAHGAVQARRGVSAAPAAS